MFSPRDVALALGASEASIKRWCDQGELQAVKTPGGHRRITLASVLAHLRRSRLPLERAEALGLPTAASPAEAAPLPGAQSLVLSALESGSYDALRDQCWARYLGGESLTSICDNLLSHAFTAIGDRWSHGTTEVYQERRACELTLRLLTELRWAVPPAAADAPRAIGCTLEGDPYELPTRMAELALLESGWRAQSLGAGIPAPSIVRALAREAPRLLWLSVSAFADAKALRAAVAKLHQAAAAQGCALALGGHALRDEVRKQLRYSFFGDSLAHLVSYADSLARRG
jgi:excisionase family DNA binding protein